MYLKLIRILNYVVCFFIGHRDDPVYTDYGTFLIAYHYHCNRCDRTRPSGEA